MFYFCGSWCYSFVNGIIEHESRCFPFGKNARFSDLLPEFRSKDFALSEGLML